MGRLKNSRARQSNLRSVAADAKGALTVTSRYDAAGNGRQMRGWAAPASGPNAALASADTIRNRMHDIMRNDWAGKSSARSLVVNLIGTGIIPRFPSLPAKKKKRVMKLWNTWVKVSDADGILNFYAQQSQTARAAVVAGEVFGRLRPRRLSDGLPVPFQLQLLEADFVPRLDADTYPGLPKGNCIRSGVEFDYLGRRSAFWLYRNHPGEATRFAGVDSAELVRVPAEFMLHIFRPERPGQVRGVSDFTSVVTRIKSAGDYDAAALTRQQIANLFAMFITQPAPTPGDTLLGQPTQSALDGGGSAVGLEPGISHTLLPGESVEFADPPDVGANYGEFMRFQHLGIAAGSGVPYEFLTGDAPNISDRVLRILVGEFRRACEQFRWNTFIPMLCEPVAAAFALYGETAGVLDAEEAAAVREAVWSPPGWEYMHPLQDAQAKALLVAEGFRARSDIIAEDGYDPDDILDRRVEDAAREKAAGLTPEPTPKQKPAPAGRDAEDPARAGDEQAQMAPEET